MKPLLILILTFSTFTLKADVEQPNIIKFSLNDSIYYVQGIFGFDGKEIKATKEIEDQIWAHLLRYEHTPIFKNMTPINISKIDFWDSKMYYLLYDKAELSLKKYNKDAFKVISILPGNRTGISFITDISPNDKKWIESNNFKSIKELPENKGCYDKIFSSRKISVEAE